MKIRRLKQKDAKYMYEWMQDSRITKYLYKDFSKFTLQCAKDFIRKANNDQKNICMAIVSENDEYIGTVSLKNVDYNTKSAELAMVVRWGAMGSGYSWFALTYILNYAFAELGLLSVYWCVHKSNERAIRFYDKHRFKKAIDVSDDVRTRYKNMCDRLLWYAVYKGDDYLDQKKERNFVNGCRIIDINTKSTVNAGELSFFEAGHEFDFDIKRIYYITRVSEGIKRGGHAHRKLKQVMFCPYGRIQIILDDGQHREEYTLDNPAKAIVIDGVVWREMIWLQTDSVLCVGASEYYDEKDYIRSYEDFLSLND